MPTNNDDQRTNAAAWTGARRRWREARQQPPWSQIGSDDLRCLLSRSSIPLRRIRRVVDIGSCDARRVLQAFTAIEALNREDLNVTCVDICPEAIEAGRERWSRLVEGEPGPGGPVPLPRPRFRVGFVHASATRLPASMGELTTDLWIDWMMLHGLPKRCWRDYRLGIEQCKPRYFVLKCFTREHGTLTHLPQTIEGVEKHQLSDADVSAFLGHDYQLLDPPIDWPERLDAHAHSDGIEAAKRAYVFQRRRP